MAEQSQSVAANPRFWEALAAEFGIPFQRVYRFIRGETRKGAGGPIQSGALRGKREHSELADPMHTVPTRDRMGLVTVDGTDYEIADIGLRMLTPRELFRAQGFPENYQITTGADGRRFTKDQQVRCCGNSVCPPIARALVASNAAEVIEMERREAA